MSIEDLKTAQRAHEEALRQKAKQEESQKAQKSQQKDRAREDYEPRMELIAEQEALKQEVKRMEEMKIQERAEETKSLKETEYQKQQELESSKAELDNLEEELRQIQELVAGKEEVEVAAPVKEAIQELSKQIPEAKRRHLGISSLLEGVRSGQVSDEELAKYRESKDKIAEIEAKILDMESNPEMVEMMMAEGKSEWEQRKKVNDGVIGYMRAYGKEDQQKVLEELAQGFIDEEIKASGIDKIRNTEERIKATNDMIGYIAVGIKFKYGEIKADNEYQATALAAAHGLKNILSGSTWIEDALNALLREIPGKEYRTNIEYEKDSAGRRQRMNAAVERHLGTINLMRAYNQGMKEYRDDIAPGSYRGNERMDQFGREISQKGDFIAGREGPILPREITPAQKKEIEEAFLKNKKKAEALEEKLRGDEIQHLTGEIERVNQELADMQARIQEAIGAERVVEREKGTGRGKPEFDELIGKAEQEIKNLSSDLEESKNELAGLGMFSFSEKNMYKLRIEHDTREIPRAEKDLAELKQRKEAYENAVKLLSKSLGRESSWGGHSYERFVTSQGLGLEKAKTQRWLEDKKKRLESLQKSVEKK